MYSRCDDFILWTRKQDTGFRIQETEFRRQNSGVRIQILAELHLTHCSLVIVDCSLIIVNLRALQFSAVVDVHRFPLCEEIVHRPASLAVTVTGLLHAAEWQVGFRTDSRNINVRDSSFDVADRYECFVDIAGIDR
jgi:hypothetical protein